MFKKGLQKRYKKVIDDLVAKRDKIRDKLVAAHMQYADLQVIAEDYVQQATQACNRLAYQGMSGQDVLSHLASIPQVEYDALPLDLKNQCEEITRLQQEVRNTQTDWLDAEHKFMQLQAAYENTDGDLRRATQQLNDYVSTKDHMKSMGKSEYEAWKNEYERALSGF